MPHSFYTHFSRAHPPAASSESCSSVLLLFINNLNCSREIAPPDSILRINDGVGVSSSLTHRLSITDAASAAATAAFPSSFFYFSTFHPELVPGQSDCLLWVRHYIIHPTLFLFIPAAASLSQRALCVYTHTDPHTHVGRVLGTFSFHLDYCLAFLYFPTPRRRRRVGCGLWGQWNQLERCGAQADLHL